MAKLILILLTVICLWQEGLTSSCDKKEEDDSFDKEGLVWRNSFDGSQHDHSNGKLNSFPQDNIVYDPERLGNVLKCVGECRPEKLDYHYSFTDAMACIETNCYGYALAVWHKFGTQHSLEEFVIIDVILPKNRERSGLKITYEKTKKQLRIVKTQPQPQQSWKASSLIEDHVIPVKHPEMWHHFGVRNDANNQLFFYVDGERTLSANTTTQAEVSREYQEYSYQNEEILDILLAGNGLFVYLDDLMIWKDPISEEKFLAFYDNDKKVKAEKKEMEWIIQAV